MDDDVHGNGISVVTTSKVGDQVFFRFVKSWGRGNLGKVNNTSKSSLCSSYRLSENILLVLALVLVHDLHHHILSYPVLSYPVLSSLSLLFHVPCMSVLLSIFTSTRM